MQSTEAAPRRSIASERRWSLAAAIASVTVFGLSIGQGGPLLPLLLEERGVSVALNGLNAGAAFIGVLAGPLLAPFCVRLIGVRYFLLLCFAVTVVLTLALKAFDSIAAWFVLRALLGLVGSSIFTAGEAWINQLAGDRGRGRILGIYASALSAGFGVGPLVLTLTGIEGWSPFIVNAAITAAASVPLLGAGAGASSFGRGRGASPFTMVLRAPLIICVVAMFGVFEASMMALLPIWGVRSGLSVTLAAACLSAVYFGSIVLQTLIGWLSDWGSRIAALRICCVVGLLGALVLVTIAPSSWALLCVLFVWGGTATGIYPVALSMAGDRFRGMELVTVNAAMIIAYGSGALIGPGLGGAAMELRNPQGLLWLFVLMFVCLLAASWLTTGQPRQRGSG